MHNTPIHKNMELTLEVERFGLDAAGVCHHEGRVIFVPGALPGEVVRVAITRIEKRHAFARVVQVLQPSPHRVAPPCPLYPRCGGCCALHMDYETTLEYKRAQVRDALTRVGGLSLEVPPVLGAENPWYYRNKASYPVCGEASDPQIGFYAARSHRVVPQDTPCRLHMHGSHEAMRAVREWMMAHGVAPYDEEKHVGCIRHIVTRITRAEEMMVVLVARTDRLPALEDLIVRLRAAVPGLRSLYLNIQPGRTNVIMGKEARLLWGEAFLSELQHGIAMRLSPFSFFQVNPAQCDRLYDLAIEYAGLRGGETVVDAYCGAGSISLPLAQKAARVVGLEIVAEAIEDAKANAQANGITNAEFLCGAVEDTLPRLLAEGLAPDVVVLDPPRKGCAPQVAQAVIDSRVPRVVYVSCNPATQARDAALLAAGGYVARRVQPVDMFCWTAAVECVMVFDKAK